MEPDREALEAVRAFSVTFEEFSQNVEAFGQFLHSMLNPKPEPGPPCTRILEWDENGNQVWRCINPPETTKDPLPAQT